LDGLSEGEVIGCQLRQLTERGNIPDMHELPGVPVDTDLAVQRLMIDKLRELSPGERLSRACKLSDALRIVVISGIRSRHPNYSEREVLEEFARITLEPPVAEFVISCLRRKEQQVSENR
jgi:hypothetical protein